MTNHNFKVPLNNLTADDSGNHVSGAPKPPSRCSGGIGSGLGKTGLTALNEPHGHMTSAFMPGAGEKRLLKKKKHKQKRKQEQERKRLSAPNPVRGILFSREKSASGDALRSSLVASGDVNQQPVTPALSKARVTTVESERQELPSSTESDLLVSRTASSNASATRNDKDAQSPETRRSGLEGQYDNQKRQAVQMRGADFPLRTRVNDKVEKERRGGVKVRPAEVPSTGFLGIKLPVKDHEISSELFLPAQSFLHTNNVRTRKSRGISPKKLRLSGSKAAKPAVEGTPSGKLGEIFPGTTNEARGDSHASHLHHLGEQRIKHQDSSGSKGTACNKPMENLAAGVSKESVSTGRTLSRVSPENSQRDTSDLSFLGAGESSKSHHPASITPGRHTSLKRTADGSWKSQKYGTDNVTPVLPGNAIPKPQDSNCKSSTKAKPPIPLDSDGPTRALKSTKSALGRLSRKLTGGPLDLDDAEKIGDIQQPVFRVPETKTAPIGSTNRRPKNRESRLRHKYRAPSPPAVPSIQQTLSPKHVSDNTNEVSAVTLNSLPYCSDRSVLPTRGELSLPATPSINSNHQRGEDISDRSTSPRVHRNEIQPSKLSNPHTQELHRPCFVTADLTKFDNTLPPPNATQKATLNPDRRDHVDLPASTASEDLQISKMSTHPGTKGRFDQRRNQKLSSIARPTPSSRSRPDVPALTSSPTSVSALSVGRENQNPKATNQRPSRVRRQTLSILDPIYTSAESNGHKPSVKAIYLRDQQLCAGLAVSTKGMMRPYLGFDEREPLMNNTDGLLIADQKQHLSKGTIIHIDFTKREMEIIEDVIYHISGEVDAWGTAEQVKDRLMQLLDGLSYDQWARALRHVRRSEQLRNRDSGSLLRFFKDATAGCLPSRPMLLQLAAPVKHTPPGFLAEQSVSSLLRHRQMGSGRVRSGHTSTKAMNEKIIAQTCENLVPWRSYTGASNDVMVVAWSPDGNKHAAGASAESSSYNMQYNRRNNLLLGDLELNVLIELPDHRIERPLPSSFADGPNSLQATYDACDPMLYITLTGVAFSATGNRLYTSSYDHTVKVWDVANSSQAKCVATLQHEDQVELLATSDQFHNVLTTGTRVLEDSIRIYNVAVENDDVPLSTFITLSSPKAMKDAVKELYPSVLRWGNSPQVHGYLLAGFSPRPKDEELETDDPAPDGDLCLWDIGAQKPIEVTPHSQNVFDCVWHPTLPIFATGSTCGGGIVDRSTRSVVRVYEPIHQRGKTIEYECPALDMNDVTFCPNNTNYITAGCTDGVTYVWDFRMPDKVLHKLEHGFPITPLKPGLTREQSDMGVRMALWSRSGNIFYSGSSDGIIKAWNINHSPSDVFLYDIAQLQAGVMCGAFSPDHSNLLVGDSRGAIHVLSSAPISTKEKEGCVEEIRLQRSEMVDKEDVPQAGENRGTEMRDAARELLESGELEMHPIYGAGKGPNYKGPFARYARPEGVDPIVNPILRPEIQAVQLSASQRALAGPAATVSRAERRNRKLMQDMAKVRNVTSEVEVVAWDDELGGGGERKRKRGEGKSLKGKERERSPLHHESDDDREIRFEELPETEDEGEGERRGLRSKREIEVIVID